MFILRQNTLGWQKCVAFFGQQSTKSITVTGWTASTTPSLFFTASFSFFASLFLPSRSFSLDLFLCVPPLFFLASKRCMGRRRWRVWGRSWSGSFPGSWAEGWLTPSPGPVCTLWAPTQPGPAPAWHWCYWFAAEDKTNVNGHKSIAGGDVISQWVRF